MNNLNLLLNGQSIEHLDQSSLLALSDELDDHIKHLKHLLYVSLSLLED